MRGEGWCGCESISAHTDVGITKSGWDSVVLGGLVRGKVDGVAIPPVVARILSGDSTSPLTRDGHGCPKLNAQSFARMRNQQSVHMARVIVLFEG